MTDTTSNQDQKLGQEHQRPQRVDKMLAPPTVGKRYLVPALRYVWDGVIDEWPVLIGIHQDPLLDFDIPHWHVDARFTSGAQDKRAREITLRTSHRIGQLSGEDLLCEAARSVALTQDPRFGGLLTRYRWKVRVCRRSHATAALRCPATEAKLARRFGRNPKAVKRGNRLFCPHQGAELTHVKLNDDGTLTCPMHGMRLQAVTRKRGRPASLQPSSVNRRGSSVSIKLRMPNNVEAT